MATKLNSKIPTSGRIGRFARIFEKETNRDVVEKVMKDAIVDRLSKPKTLSLQIHIVNVGLDGLSNYLNLH